MTIHDTIWPMLFLILITAAAGHVHRTQEPQDADKLYPSELFKGNFADQYNLPERFAQATIIVPCTICERYCNCQDLRSKHKSKGSQGRKFEIMRCKQDQRKLLPRDAASRCNCSSPWFTKTAPGKREYGASMRQIRTSDRLYDETNCHCMMP